MLLLTILGAVLAIGYFSGGYRRFFEFARLITFPQWVVLTIATACFYLLDYARLYTLFALLGIRIPPGVGIELTCVSYFVSSLTPTAELNIPAMMLMLHRRGIPPSQTAAVALAKALYITLWVCLFGFSTLLARREVRLPPAVADHLALLTAPAMALIAAFCYVVFFPGRVLHWTSSAGETTRWKRVALIGIRNCALALSQLGQSKHPVHLMSHLACVAFIFVYVFIGDYLCQSLALSISPEMAFAVFSNSLLVSYLSPVPGSIGVTEVLTSYFLDPTMTERGIVISTLLRFLCAYVVVVPGAVLLLSAVREVGWQKLQEYMKRKMS